jgi:hypothetical protein
MSDQLRPILRFARLGFGVTAAFFCYQLIVVDFAASYARIPAVMLAFVFLCPPSLLSLFFRDVEIGSRASYFLWTSIALLNAALYAALRALLLAGKMPARKKKLD